MDQIRNRARARSLARAAIVSRPRLIACGLVPAASVLMLACNGGTSEVLRAIQPSNGGATTQDSATASPSNGGASNTSRGSATGAVGGSANGGTANGGAPSGGRASGGSASGGRASGGSASGGRSASASSVGSGGIEALGGSSNAAGFSSGGGAASGGMSSATSTSQCSMPFVDALTNNSGCIVAAGSHMFKTYPLEEGQSAVRLAVYFHDYGAFEWFDGSAFSTIVPWARAHNTVVVAPRANNYDAAWGEANSTDALAVGASIGILQSMLGVSSDRTLFWSVSDGSWFMSFTFIRQMGQRFPGVYALNCGGSGVPLDTLPWGWDYSNVEARNSVNICLNYSSNDFLASAAKTDSDTFSRLGFSVVVNAYDTTGYCAHPVADSTIACWEAAL